MMKKFGMFTLFITMLCAATLGFAQAPQILNFQGRLNDSSGNPVADGNYSIQFLIYPVASGGTAVWNQTQTVTTQNGVFNVLLNDVTLDLTAAEYYLAMKVGSDSEMTPRQRIASVPYALQANPWIQNGNHVYFNNLSGNVGIGTTNPTAKLHVKGDIRIPVTNKIVFGVADGTGGEGEWIQNASFGIAFYGYKEERMRITNTGNVGIGTTNPQYKLHVAGTLKVEGADFAEPFEMTDIDTLELGDVVVIDSQNPLHVTKSSFAYDFTVAGIVSSKEQAGYIAGSRSNGTSEKPVALAGRVLCKVSAENGPIQVGDLLTTSSTSGHAMKATDRDKAFGAVLGKALQAFDGETGSIMVLVALQ